MPLFIDKLLFLRWASSSFTRISFCFVKMSLCWVILQSIFESAFSWIIWHCSSKIEFFYSWHSAFFSFMRSCSFCISSKSFEGALTGFFFFVGSRPKLLSFLFLGFEIDLRRKYSSCLICSLSRELSSCKLWICRWQFWKAELLRLTSETSFA